MKQLKTFFLSRTVSSLLRRQKISSFPQIFKYSQMFPFPNQSPLESIIGIRTVLQQLFMMQTLLSTRRTAPPMLLHRRAALLWVSEALFPVLRRTAMLALLVLLDVES